MNNIILYVWAYTGQMCLDTTQMELLGTNSKYATIVYIIILYG